MKNKLANWNINCQEDEDGFSLNPYEVFIYDSTDGNQDNHLNRNIANSESGHAELRTIATKENRFTNKIGNFQTV